MGLDCSHDAWSGAYSAFHRWRTTLAEIAGYDLVETESGARFASPVINGNWSPDNYQGHWGGRPPEDPLLILLVHSDCDGEIEPKDCHWLALRLETLLPKLVEMGDGTGHIRNWATTTERFINGLRSAYELDEPLEFE
jgi:hypothetical protein